MGITKKNYRKEYFLLYDLTNFCWVMYQLSSWEIRVIFRDCGSSCCSYQVPNKKKG